MSNEWGAKTKFPSRKKRSDRLRVVHNFIPVNKYTLKPQYPMYCLEKVLETLLRPKFKCFVSINASNGYWAVPMKKEHKNKMGIVTPHGQYYYLQMGQGLKRRSHTFSQFSNLVFGPIPKSINFEAQPTCIGDYGDWAFMPFIDDYMGAAINFDSFYTFLCEHFFSCV